MSVIYDEALFYTDKEMEKRGKENTDVQSLIERPRVYILARCGSSEAEQLAYINTRRACLESLTKNTTTPDGIEIGDTCRGFL